jgi:hypothetical protein
MKKLFPALIVLVSVYLSSCCTKAGCDLDFPYKIAFSGFDSTDLDTVTVLSYTTTNPVKLMDSFTTTIRTKDTNNRFELSLKSRANEFHYRILLHSLGREYKFDNYVFGDAYHCNDCFPQRDMYQQELKSYYLNGALKVYDKKQSLLIEK